MSGHNLRPNLALAALCAILPQTWGARPILATPPAPTLDVHDRRFLSQSARRAVTACAETESVYKASYVPPSLKDVAGYSIVTLRRQGRKLGIGASGSD